MRFIVRMGVVVVFVFVVVFVGNGSYWKLKVENGSWTLQIGEFRDSVPERRRLHRFLGLLRCLRRHEVPHRRWWSVECNS